MDNDTQNHKKEIHIVFKVLNFLHSKESEIFNLLPIDKLILITLASHHGPKGIYPGMATIAKEQHISRQYTSERISHLVGIGLISIKKVWRTNHYELCFLKFSCQPQLTQYHVNHRRHDKVSHVNCSCASCQPQLHIYNKEEEHKEKSFYMQKSKNEKKHDFAHSMDQMASEERNIRKHEEMKKAPIAASVRTKLNLKIK